MKKIMQVATSFMLCLPIVAKAHPGHGNGGGYTITHYIMEPIHAVIWISAFISAVLLVKHFGRNRKQSTR